MKSTYGTALGNQSIRISTKKGTEKRWGSLNAGDDGICPGVF